MGVDNWDDHPAVRSSPDELSRGERAAEWVAAKLGSWSYLCGQSLFILLWVIANSWHGWGHAWDGYPFILLNLLFSTQAAYAAPIIMLAANRTDKVRAELALNQYEMTQQILSHLNQPRNPEN